MSDVLTAAQVQEMTHGNSLGYWLKPEYKVALARSHEQLRGERDDARVLRDAWQDACDEESARAEAAVRAGGNAADALRQIEECCQAWVDTDDVSIDTTDQLGWQLAAHRRAEMVLTVAREALAALEPAEEKT